MGSAKKRLGLAGRLQLNWPQMRVFPASEHLAVVSPVPAKAGDHPQEDRVPAEEGSDKRLAVAPIEFLTGPDAADCPAQSPARGPRGDPAVPAFSRSRPLQQTAAPLAKG